MKLQAGMLGSVSALALACAGSPALAQSVDAGSNGQAVSTGSQLPASSASGDEVVVTGQRASLARAADIKRHADAVVDTIVAADIGKFPDNTVAEALQRVPGVQASVGFNNEIVNPLVRGLPDILTTLDGREIFAGVGRGFSFQDLPAEALARADVYKSNTADQIEGGVAGVINLGLQKPMNFTKGLTVVANARGIYGDKIGQVSYTGGVLVSDRWDTGAGEMGLLVDASYSRVKFDRPATSNCDPISGTFAPPSATGVVIPVCTIGEADYGVYKRPQVNAAFQWRPTPELEIYADGLYAGYRSEWQSDYIFANPFTSSSITNVVASDTCFDEHIAGGWQGGPNDPIEHLCYGKSAVLHNVVVDTGDQAKEARSDQHMIAGGARYNSGALHLNLDLSSWQSKNSDRTIIVEPAKVVPEVDMVINDHGMASFTMPGNPTGTPDDFRFYNGLYQAIDRSNSKLFAAKADGKYDINSSFLREIQFGVRYADRDAAYRAITPGGPPAPGGNLNTLINSVGLPSDFLQLSPTGIDQIDGGQRWITASRDYIMSHTDQLRAIYGAPAGDPAFSPTQNFDANEKTYAGYLQARYEVALGEMSLDGLVGGRLTRSDRQLTGTGVVNTVLTPVTTDTSDTNFLPNASARLKIMPNLQVRATYARTLSRPAFSVLNPGLNLDNPVNQNVQPSGSGGNPNLKPELSDAYDATVEYYFGPANYLSAAVYYRTIKDRIVNDVAPETFAGVVYQVNRPRNVGAATLKGLELSGQSFFDFLPGPLAGFGTFANFTLADTKVTTKGDPLEGEPLEGVSKYSYNAGLLYEHYGITGRLAYTWRSKYNSTDLATLVRPGTDPAYNVVKSYGRLDFSLGYDITKSIHVSVDGTNILGATYNSYWDNPAYPHDMYEDETTYSFSIRARF